MHPEMPYYAAVFIWSDMIDPHHNAGIMYATWQRKYDLLPAFAALVAQAAGADRRMLND